ncbi:hypothetical protein L7F22_068669 [Adiantum nelumboides]|nr:hypothetical protein [Adiantum nelumboides]
MKIGKQQDLSLETSMDEFSTESTTTSNVESTMTEESHSSIKMMGVILNDPRKVDPPGIQPLVEDSISVVQHHINLKEGSKPVVQRLRRLGVIQQDALLSEVRKLLQEDTKELSDIGIQCISHYDWHKDPLGTPIFPIPKNEIFHINGVAFEVRLSCIQGAGYGLFVHSAIESGVTILHYGGPKYGFQEWKKICKLIPRAIKYSLVEDPKVEEEEDRAYILGFVEEGNVSGYINSSHCMDFHPNVRYALDPNLPPWLDKLATIDCSSSALCTNAQKLRRLGVVKEEALLKEVRKLLSAGFIYPVDNSEWVSPVVVTPKKNGKWRVCVDYRPLNEATKRDHFPLPFQDEILNEVARHEKYTVCDGYSGYFQIRIAEEDQKKTTFITPWGCYAFRVMPFGLTNAPATFQRFMNHVFQAFFGKSIRVYIDDFCIYSSKALHVQKVEEGLQRLNGFGGQLNPDKCHIGEDEVILLGHKISQRGIEVDPAKAKALLELPSPKSIKEVMSFMQKVKYMAIFIHLASELLHPLQKFSTSGICMVGGPRGVFQKH